MTQLSSELQEERKALHFFINLYKKGTFFAVICHKLTWILNETCRQLVSEFYKAVPWPSSSSESLQSPSLFSTISGPEGWIQIQMQFIAPGMGWVPVGTVPLTVSEEYGQ